MLCLGTGRLLRKDRRIEFRWAVNRGGQVGKVYTVRGNGRMQELGLVIYTLSLVLAPEDHVSVESDLGLDKRSTLGEIGASSKE